MLGVKMKKKIFAILTAITVVAVLLSACATSFPTKEKITALKTEEASKLLIDKTQQEIHDNWGIPDSVFSGLYGDIYSYDNKCIGIYYDYDSKQVTDIVIWTKDDNTIVDPDDVFLVGKDVIITKAEIDQSMNFYILAGYSENEALETAIIFLEKYATMYYLAKNAGFFATEKEIDERIDLLKDMSKQNDNENEFQKQIDSFESEEAYWEYERSILRKDMAIELYRKSELEPKFAQLSNHEQGSEEYWSEWAEWYDNYQTKMAEDQEFKFATDLSKQDIENAINHQ